MIHFEKARDILSNPDFFYGIFAHFAILVGVGQIEADLIAEGHWIGFYLLSQYDIPLWASRMTPYRHQRLRSRLMVLEGLNWFALKKCINLESFQSTKVLIF
jgi:hypothetical protein